MQSQHPQLEVSLRLALASTWQPRLTLDTDLGWGIGLEVEDRPFSGTFFDP